MGTKILGVIAFAAIAIAADWNYQQNKQEVELSDLALENIDALARGEHGPDWGHSKLVYEPNGCCKDDPYLDCSWSIQSLLIKIMPRGLRACLNFAFVGCESCIEDVFL
ncbi:NVEALA domain-containing protein [Parabacteroides merdae]|nr:NVEALA domain-containing protein [Parabacteroides merdae]